MRIPLLAAISGEAIRGTRSIDARLDVVAPCSINLHSHVVGLTFRIGVTETLIEGKVRQTK